MGSLFEVITVTDHSSPAKVIVEKGTAVTIANIDNTNPVFLGHHHSIDFSDQNVAPLGPGQAIPFTGKSDVFAIALPGQSTDVLVLPGAVGWFGSAGQSPSAVPPSVVSIQGVGSGVNQTIIGNVLNPKSLSIQLVSACISSTASNFGPTGAGSGFSVTDQIIDTLSNNYLGCEVSLPQLPAGVALVCPNSVSMKFENSIVPAGAKLQVSNGGAGGTTALRQCSVTVVFYLIGMAE